MRLGMVRATLAGEGLGNLTACERVKMQARETSRIGRSHKNSQNGDSRVGTIALEMRAGGGI